MELDLALLQLMGNLPLISTGQDQTLSACTVFTYYPIFKTFVKKNPKANKDQFGSIPCTPVRVVPVFHFYFFVPKAKVILHFFSLGKSVFLMCGKNNYDV